MVGFTKLPDSWPGTLALRPSTRILAPDFSPSPMRVSMRDLLCGVMTGPIWTPSSRPLPTRSLEAESAMASRKAFCASPMATATETARQRWPAQPKALSLMMLVHGHIGIRENDDGIFRAALALGAFAAGGGASVEVLGDGSGADEADGADFRMIEERIHGDFAAVD